MVCVETQQFKNIDSLLENLSSNSIVQLNQSVLHNITKFNPIANLTNVTIKGPANITCNEGVGLAFLNMTNFTLDSITIQQCGLTGHNLSQVNAIIQTEVANTSYQFRPGIKVGMFVIGSVNVAFQNVTIKETQGIGVAFINVLGVVNFSDVMFVSNRPASLQECYKCLFPFILSDKLCLYNPASVSGSLLLLYTVNHINYPSHDTHVTITQSSFIDNLSCSVADLFNAIAALYPSLSRTYRNATVTGGIKVIFSQNQDSYNVSVQVMSSLFRNNTALSGSAINVEVFEGVYDSTSVIVKDCDFSYNGVYFLNVSNVTTFGGSITVNTNIHPFNPTPFLSKASFSLHIKKCKFSHNFASLGGAVFITNGLSPRSCAYISDCYFEENSGVRGNCIYAGGIATINEFTAIIIANSLFMNNSVIESFSFDNSQGSHGAVYLSFINAEVSDAFFNNNSGSAVNLIFSTLTLSGQVTFDGNRAFDGGALYLQINSEIVIANNSKIMFANNGALSRGGAVFFNLDDLSTERVRGCFLFFSTYDPYCLLTQSCYSEDMNISVNFINNIAPTGSALFGFDLDCPWLYERGYNSSENKSILNFINNTYGNVLRFSPSITDNGVVSTSSHRINTDLFNRTIIPGQIITLKLNASDFYGRSVVSVVGATTLTSSFLTSGNYSAVISGSGFQFLQKNLSTATQIKVNGTEDSSTDFVVYSVSSNAQTMITVNFTDCPPFGFYYNCTYHGCVCDPNFENTGVTCDYNAAQLIKPEDKWVGQLNNKAVVLSCLFDYCSENISVNPYDLDGQCSDDRAGVLCGGCREGYGITIALEGCSNNCPGVRNVILWLLGAFVISLWLVIVTAFIHFYISDGFLYGFLFYNNTLLIFRRAFFESSSSLSSILSSDQYLFHSGFCLHKEMTALVANTLQFVPSIFVFILMGIVILLARKFNIFNRKFYFSITKTFATLLYFVYNWLLNASFTLLVSHPIKTPSGIEYRWRIDPNVIYFNGWHAGLGVISLIIIIVLSAIALLLLFPGVAYKFKLVQKFKPLMDPFQAPFKLEYSFWIGLQLSMRIIMYILVIFVPEQHQLYCVGIVVLILLIAQTTFSPYKIISSSKFPNFRNFLDNLFLFLLIAHIIEVQSFGDVNVLSAICFTVNLSLYIGLVLYYFFKRFPRLKRLLLKTCCCYGRKQESPQNFHSNLDSEMEENDDDDAQLEFYKSVRSDYPNATTSSININFEIPEPVNYAEFRESLLKTD